MATRAFGPLRAGADAAIDGVSDSICRMAGPDQQDCADRQRTTAVARRAISFGMFSVLSRFPGLLVFIPRLLRRLFRLPVRLPAGEGEAMHARGKAGGETRLILL